MTADQPTEEQVDRLTAALVNKVSSNPATWDLESGVRQVVVDTWLVAAGAVTIEDFERESTP